jgi:endoglycosylceramidase
VNAYTIGVLSRATSCCALALIAPAACHSVNDAPTAPVFASGGTIVDPQGRTVVLRGVNARADAFFDDNEQLVPLPPFTVDDCQFVGEQLGGNQVRLPINWSYLEPTQGTLDSSYVAAVLALAAGCAQVGVYTLIDLHQDGWSKYVGQDGAPFWAHQPSLPDDDMDQHDGNQASTSTAVQTEMSGFFADTAGLIPAYASMASRLAAQIDKQPGIIGLELMNEPIAPPDQLNAFYSTVASAVRAVAPGLPLYAEPSATRNIVDFAQPPIIPQDDLVYSPHLYTGVFQGDWVVGDNARIEASIQNMQSEAAKIHAPIVVTEFGNDPADPTGAAWLAASLDLLDQYALSASLWVYEEWPSTCGQPSCWGLYDEAPAGDGSYVRALRSSAVALIARPYPQAIAGTLESFAYDQPSATLTVQLHGTTGTHLLAAPMLVYPNDVTVTCDGDVVPATRTGGSVAVECTGSTLVMTAAD